MPANSENRHRNTCSPPGLLSGNWRAMQSCGISLFARAANGNTLGRAPQIVLDLPAANVPQETLPPEVDAGKLEFPQQDSVSSSFRSYRLKNCNNCVEP